MKNQKTCPTWLIDEMRKELEANGYYLKGQSDNAIQAKYKYFKDNQD